MFTCYQMIPTDGTLSRQHAIYTLWHRSHLTEKNILFSALSLKHYLLFAGLLMKNIHITNKHSHTNKKSKNNKIAATQIRMITDVFM